MTNCATKLKTSLIRCMSSCTSWPGRLVAGNAFATSNQRRRYRSRRVTNSVSVSRLQTVKAFGEAMIVVKPEKSCGFFVANCAQASNRSQSNVKNCFANWSYLLRTSGSVDARAGRAICRVKRAKAMLASVSRASSSCIRSRSAVLSALRRRSSRKLKLRIPNSSASGNGRWLPASSK